MKVKNCTIRINLYRRALCIEDTLGACVITGTDKIRSGFGNGDCVMIDARHGVFAVADGSERFPTASRGLLERFHQMLQDANTPQSGDEWLVLLNRLYVGQKYEHKTTICVFIRSDLSNGENFVIHGGDSMVIVYDTRDGKILFGTKPDMNFVGRGMGISHIESPALQHDSRIIVATDGFNDVTRLFGYDGASRLPALFCTAPLHEIPDLIRERLKSAEIPGEYDDVGFIALDPRLSAGACDLRVMIGGTTAQEEQSYQDWITAEESDRWIDSRSDDFCENLQRPGFTMFK